MSHPILDAILHADMEVELTPLPVQPLVRTKGAVAVDFQNEKPVHRQICYLAAAGYRVKDIAALVDHGEGTVRAVLKSPRGRAFIADIIHDHHDDEISMLIKGGCVDAVLTLRELCTDAQSESTRVACAKELLTQARATPTRETPLSLLEEIESLPADDEHAS